MRRVLFALFLAACVDPPPKISAIPSSGLALKIYVFGASAQEARRAFEAAKQNNQGFSVVNEGGDGEVLIGLENDSPKCVPPTALCSYRVAFRVKSYKGDVVHTSATTVSANADRCADLCAKALNNLVVKVVETAANSLKNGPPPAEEKDPEDAGADAEVDAAPPPIVRGKKPPPPKKVEPPPKPTPPICTVATGPRLASEEAEKRAAQVEVLKRLNVIDQDEYDCLRKAYLDRL
jgi:hypothetical protein